MNPTKFLTELKRRNVYKVGIAYGVVALVSTWNGGGLHAETDPKTGGTQDCFALEQATPNGFVLAKINPNNGIFRCDGAKSIYTLKKPGQGVTLQDVGLTMADFK